MGQRRAFRAGGYPPPVETALAAEHAVQHQFPAGRPGQGQRFCGDDAGQARIADNLTEGVDPRGRPYYWIGPVRESGSAEPGSDVCALLDNKVSITPIYLLTNVPVLASLRKVFE